MAGITGAFADALNRKYANLEANTQGENQLRDAQAQQITSAIPSENALRNAQTGATNAQTGATQAATATVAPLAQSQIGLQSAQAGFAGAEAGQIHFNTDDAASDAELGNFHRQTTNNNSGLDASAGIGVFRRPGYSYTSPFSPQGFSAGTSNVQPRPNDQRGYNNEGHLGQVGGDVGPLQAINGGLMPNDPYAHYPEHYAAGTSNVKGAPMASPAPLPPVGTDPMQQGMGLFDHMHGIVTHAMHALHAAGGATTIQPMPTPAPAPPPAPGQTVTNGQWGPGQNQTLRDRMGYGVKAAGGMTSAMAPPMAGPAAPVQPGGDTKVPGKGDPGVDKVPAVLAPGEAVLNQGAATHMGRGAIAALNALGAHSMAMAGTPPQMGPTAHGTPMPMGGDKTMKPIARGMPKSPSKPTGKTMPPAKAKSPMAKGKVAAGGKGK